jgi:hypothetical protein
MLGLGFLKFVGDEKPRAEKPKRQKRVKRKNDPKYVAAARELRDRYLEHINSDPTALPEPQGKYEVCRTSASSVDPRIQAPHRAALPVAPMAA